MPLAQKKQPIIALHDGEKYLFVNECDILYCVADANKSTLYLSDNTVTSVSKKISEVETMLKDYGFLRIHKSYLINLLHIKQFFNQEENNVLMSNGQKIPIARSRKTELLNRFIRI